MSKVDIFRKFSATVSKLIFSVDGRIGTLLANDQMGVTIFDLFGEIMTVPDMENYLSKNLVKVNDFQTATALAIRCFLLLLDSTKEIPDSKVLPVEISLASDTIKTEIMEIDTMEATDHTEPEFYMPDDTVAICEQDPNAKDNRGKFKIRRSRQNKNLCVGPGCNCGQSFPSKQAKEQHYIEKGCYRCSCGQAFSSQALLNDHAGKFCS